MSRAIQLGPSVFSQDSMRSARSALLSKFVSRAARHGLSSRKGEPRYFVAAFSRGSKKLHLLIVSARIRPTWSWGQVRLPISRRQNQPESFQLISRRQTLGAMAKWCSTTCRSQQQLLK